MCVPCVDAISPPSWTAGPRLRMTHLLVAINEARRTGAPLNCLDLMRWLHPSVRTTVVAKRSGPLESEFGTIADRLIVQPGGRLYPWLVRSRFRSLPVGGAIDRRIAHKVLSEVSPQAVYVDTIVAADYAIAAIERGLPTVLSVHELDPWLGVFLRTFGAHDVLRRAQLVANSHATAVALARALDMDAEAITVAHPPVDDVRVQRLSEQRALQLRAPIVGCGSVAPIKGVDLLPRLSVAIARELGQPAAMVWIGEGPMRKRLSASAARHLGGRLTFAGSLDNPYPVLGAAEVVVIPSRQEPLSLVALEALALGRPVVAFAVGGLPEAVGDAGVLVPPSDIDGMAREVVRLLQDEAAREDLRRRGPARVRERFSPMQYRAAMAEVLAHLGVDLVASGARILEG